MKFLNKSEAVSYYHSLQKFGIMPGLERISLLCERLGSPHKKLKFIHVAGTNGKGSTCTAIASVLTAAGYNTGLYTSPYVIDFCERIQINGRMISENELISCTERVRSAIEQLNSEDIKITEFEAVTAAAFLFYSEMNCDFVVLETGLGGRFDATNIIEAPLLSIITSVSLDHTGVLGSTLSEIAFEKSGIIKKNCPVITGAEQPCEVSDVIHSEAEKKNAPFVSADASSVFSLKYEGIDGSEVESAYGRIKIPFTGLHQLNNMALVIKAVEIIRSYGFNVSNEALSQGIASARIPARTEIISSEPMVILDGSHNDGSTKALGDIIRKHHSDKKIIAVMGMMADKDVRSSLSNIVPHFDTVIATMPSNPRSMPASELAEIVLSFGVDGIAVDSPEKAVTEAFSRIDEFDMMIVCGSLYLAGDVRNILIKLSGDGSAEK